MSAAQYAILGLNPRNKPTERDITKAYRSLSLRHHPDKAPNDPDAQRKFCALHDAYEAVLLALSSRKRPRDAAEDEEEQRRTDAEWRARSNEDLARQMAERRAAQRAEIERRERERLERERREEAEMNLRRARQREQERLAESQRRFAAGIYHPAYQGRTEEVWTPAGFQRVPENRLSYQTYSQYDQDTATGQYMHNFEAGLSGMDFGDVFDATFQPRTPRYTGVFTAGGGGTYQYDVLNGSPLSYAEWSQQRQHRPSGTRGHTRGRYTPQPRSGPSSNRRYVWMG